VAGAGTGVVEADELLGPDRVRAGDVVVAMASSGLHSNGYSLVRQVFFTTAGWDVGRAVPELGRTLGDELLEPTRIYALDCLALARDLGAEAHAMAHVTGGGFAANLQRVVPGGFEVVLERSTWTPAPVFGLVGALGAVPAEELERTLNMGVGMAAVVAPEAADRAVGLLRERGVEAWVVGHVTAGERGVRLAGAHPG
jgi:phosphoribosylformylglycinamidine cyclo-ligase